MSNKKGYIYSRNQQPQRPPLKMMLIIYMIAIFGLTFMLGRWFPELVYWIMGGMVVVQIALAIALRPWVKRLNKEIRQSKVR